MAQSVKKSSRAAFKRAPVKNQAKSPVKKSVVKAGNKATKTVTKKASKAVAKKVIKKATKKTTASPAKRNGKTFLIIYHAPLEAIAQSADLNPEQQAASMALWQEWAERCGIKLLDMGAPLMNGRRIGSEGEPTASTREVAGYSLLSAEDWDDVMTLLEGHPHISGWHPSATIEIHETMAMPGL